MNWVQVVKHNSNNLVHDMDAKCSVGCPIEKLYRNKPRRAAKNASTLFLLPHVHTMVTSSGDGGAMAGDRWETGSSMGGTDRPILLEDIHLLRGWSELDEFSKTFILQEV